MFNSSSQKDLDLYFEGHISDEEMEIILESQWNYKSAGYMEMIKAAKDNGTRIIGIDHRDLLADLSLDFSDELMERDRLMAQVINEELDKGLCGKMIVYTGKLHSFKSLGQKLDTVADYVRREHPDKTGVHYMGYNLRSKNFLTDLYKSHFSNIRDLAGSFLSTKSLLPYADGAFYFYE